ncbi:TetR/AcrR family transcriptional regulator [Prevotella sp. kh1p2]|uniref:TetR/AcrR family transcriptional regulator n=1 Tax=Prevotella sp. kh1p2 TaxID=1761883 RepID=UPI0008D805DC|nr:TetR/AcrR family transcriptional regulator [Prevotella sp. kh1p2]SES77027.1 transcriptional regulator, TetR family [Prevotella sp. kh1p2]SNU10452.1 transcriptional regulator, TetR family [Prevotellaceae bacterium KH2P17]
MEKNRATTEAKLLQAVGEIIARDGFEALGIRKIAEQANANKTLIYRYFNSMNGLIVAYLKANDFWTSPKSTNFNGKNAREHLKNFYRQEVSLLRANVALRKLRCWELTTENELIDEIRERREENGRQFMEEMVRYAATEKNNIQAIATLLDAGIVNLALCADKFQFYNGIDIQSNEGWEQILRGIDTLIDALVKSEDE